MSKIGRLRAALLELLAEHERSRALPTSARFLFYELVARGVLSKERKERGRRPDQDMSDALTDLRERGEVPWDWIVDETRSLENFTGAPTIGEWMLEVLPQARLDPWAGDVPLILTESRSLAGVLRSLTDEYAARSRRLTVNAAGFCTLKLYRSCDSLSESSIWETSIYPAVRSKTTRAAYLNVSGRVGLGTLGVDSGTGR